MTMLVKFHARGKGGGSGPVDYLLGKNRDREQATVIRGNPEQTRELIDSLDFKTKYTSGVLSFEESDIPEHQKQELMNELERHLMSGLDRDQYDCLWVQHQDKDRLELNFVIPNVELLSNKRLQPYYDKIDRARNDAFQTWVNGKYDFADPNDPSRRRTMSYAHDLPNEHKNVAEHITSGLLAITQAGEISNRDDIIKSLEDNGFTVARKTKNSISIAVPGHAKNIRLKGAIYEQDFRPSQSLRAEIEANILKYRQERKHRTEQARKLYQEKVSAKSEYNRQRYPRTSERTFSFVNKAPERAQQNIKKRTGQSNNNDQHRFDYRDFGNGNTVSTGLEISNNQLKDRVNKYERLTEANGIRHQEVGSTATATKQRIRGTSESISATIKRLAGAVGDYATAVIKLSSLRREQRNENRPSFGFRR